VFCWPILYDRRRRINWRAREKAAYTQTKAGAEKQMRTRTLVALLACCATAALADARSDRQAVMKANNAAISATDGLVTGAFKLAEVKKQAQLLIDNGGKIAVLFAPGTDHNDTGIKAELWSDAAGFKAANDKFIADAKTLLTAPDRIATAHAMVVVQADCATCHKAYRVMPAAPAGRGVPRGGAP